jgi:hypothetical protein
MRLLSFSYLPGIDTFNCARLAGRSQRLKTSAHRDGATNFGRSRHGEFTPNLIQAGLCSRDRPDSRNTHPLYGINTDAKASSHQNR